jgi:hypothetical protein
MRKIQDKNYKLYGLGSIFSSVGKFVKNNPDMLKQAAGLGSSLAGSLANSESTDESNIQTDESKTADTVQNAVQTGIGFIPGVGTAASAVLGGIDTIGNMVGGKTGEFIKNLNPLTAINTMITGDSKKKALEALKTKQDLISANNFTKNNAGLNNAAYLSAKKGMKLESGGVLPSFNSNKNVILKGVLHKEENNTGDKGIPVIHCDTGKCEKVAEIEKEELVLTRERTAILDKMVAKADSTKDTIDYLAIGKYMYNELTSNTIDNTK